MIKIVGLGPGSVDALTIGTLEALRNSDIVLLRTKIHPTVEYLIKIGIKFETYDEKYESMESFDDVYKSIAEDIIEKSKMNSSIVYALPGHPLVAERSVSMLIKLCEAKNIPYQIFPAVSFIDAIMERLEIDPAEGLKIVDAFDIKDQLLDKRTKIIISQVYNKFIASEVKLTLMNYYDEDTNIFFIRAAGVKGEESIREIPLYSLDRQEDIDYLTSVFIPKSPEKATDFQDLLNIMDKLRGEEGCPWDKEQDHKSLKRYLIEECYEVLEAIDKKDEAEICEELGDVLLQVVFHSRIGKEEGYFNINDVIKGISSKMINRHPHIFGNESAMDSNEVLHKWDEIKTAEKGYESYTEQLKHIGKNLPALIRAEKVQKKAAQTGFDLRNVEDAMDKLLEELSEAKDVYKSKNMTKIGEEIGDLIFSSVNVARFLDIDPENALNYTIDKFVSRFEYIEERATEKGIKLGEMTLEEMDLVWQNAKVQENHLLL